MLVEVGGSNNAKSWSLVNLHLHCAVRPQVLQRQWFPSNRALLLELDFPLDGLAVVDVAVGRHNRFNDQVMREMKTLGNICRISIIDSM